MLNAGSIYRQIATAMREPRGKQTATQIIQDAIDQARKEGWEEGMSDGIDQAAADDLDQDPGTSGLAPLNE